MNSQPPENKDEDKKHKDFVVNIVQYLQNKHGIVFFINSLDYHTLCDWYDKRIPIGIVKESIAAVAERWKAKNKKIFSFSNFRYEVRKNFKSFLQLDVGSNAVQEAGVEKKNEFEEIEAFFNDYPEELAELRQGFEAVFQQLKNGENLELAPLHHKLADLFKADSELKLKTEIFMKNLAPELRKPEIEQRYKLNYLINKFNIPDFQDSL